MNMKKGNYDINNALLIGYISLDVYSEKQYNKQNNLA